MKQTTLIFGLAVLFGFSSCNSTNTKNVQESHEGHDHTSIVDTIHTSQSSLDWAGTYEGTLPCADCAGIKTTILLNEDETFNYQAIYVDKNTSINSAGKLMWHDNGNVIHLKGDNLDAKYKVGENHLIFLDTEGTVIDGSNADHYILTKK